LKEKEAMDLSGHLALITGAGQGIGRACAEVFAFKGADLILFDKNPETLSETADRVKRLKRQVVTRALDLTDVEALQQTIKELKRKGCIDILVNNAGITQDNILLRMKEDEWQRVIETNLTAVFRLSKAVLRAMTKARWGRIINVSSVVGSMGNAGQANYAASKAGMEGFSRSLAREVGSRGITINCVAPGFIDTDMTRSLPDAQREALLAQIPLARLGQAEEIAKAVSFLASAGAGYITGETIHVNGGMYMA